MIPHAPWPIHTMIPRTPRLIHYDTIHIGQYRYTMISHVLVSIHYDYHTHQYRDTMIPPVLVSIHYDIKHTGQYRYTMISHVLVSIQNSVY